MSYYFAWRPYVPVAERRRQAAREAGQARRRRAKPSRPVTIEGRTIAKTFWGKSWCDNLERYSDFANRLPRGRTYVRNGSVVDLQIAKGEVTALVSGSELYNGQGDDRAGQGTRAGRRSAATAPARSIRWSSCCRAVSPRASWSGSAGEGDGLFPSPSEIKLSCSCPDWAGHVQARRGGALRRRRPARRKARASFRAARRG